MVSEYKDTEKITLNVRCVFKVFAYIIVLSINCKICTQAFLFSVCLSFSVARYIFLAYQSYKSCHIGVHPILISHSKYRQRQNVC